MAVAMLERVLYLLILLYKDCWSLNLTGIFVPRFKIEGDEAQLECHYELNDEKLYAVKWYKSEEEFYKYVLRGSPQITSYPMEGVLVDNSRSDKNRVLLKNVSSLSSGVYRCEVSAEAPSFSSATAAARMIVQHLPESGPYITGERKQYQIGDDLSINCTSGISYPASVLHWYINDHEVENEDQGLIGYKTPPNKAGLIRTVLGLDLRLSRFHFRKGRAELRCVATYPFGGEFPEGEALTAGGHGRIERPNNKWEAILIVSLNSSFQVTAASCQTLTIISVILSFVFM